MVKVLLKTKAALTAKLFMKECWVRQSGCSWPTHGVPGSQCCSANAFYVVCVITVRITPENNNKDLF